MSEEITLSLAKAANGWDVQRDGETVATLRKLRYHRGWKLRVKGVPFLRAPDTHMELGRTPYPGIVDSKAAGIKIVTAVLLSKSGVDNPDPVW